MKKYFGSILAVILIALTMLAVAQDAKTKEYKLSEVQQLKLNSAQKDLVIQAQQLQMLQQQYQAVAAQNQASQKAYAELAEQIRKDNKWDDAEFDPQTGTFHQKAATPAPTTKK